MGPANRIGLVLCRRWHWWRRQLAWCDSMIDRDRGTAFGTQPQHFAESRSGFGSQKNRILAVTVALCTKPMRWFAGLGTVLSHANESALPNVFQFVFLLLSIPSFKASHFFFKLAYSLNQLRLRDLCGEDLFLQFYDRRVANGCVVDILQSLGEIKHGLESAKASEHFGNPERFTPPRLGGTNLG
jgi:hypothetical protein